MSRREIRSGVALIAAGAAAWGAWMGTLSGVSGHEAGAATVLAQSSSPPSGSTLAERPPALLARVTDDEPSEPMSIARVSVHAIVVGFLARTTTTITFRNDLDRVLEGELVFPLPEGATVSGYGLDIDGQMVDAVVVERRAARVAFEKEVRKGIDPGLVEWVKGNNFRTRVWPIPARGTRTVKVEYVSDLVTEGSGDAFAALYYLPLRYPTPVDDLELRVEVVKSPVVPEIVEGTLANFRFARWDDRYVAETRLQNVTLGEDLRVALPRIPRQTVFVERDESGGHAFVIDDLPEAPGVAPAPKAPRRVGLLWDASLSRAQTDAARETALVEAWLAGLKEVEVEVAVFRNVPEAPRRFRVRNGDTQALREHLAAQPLDGATNLGALSLSDDVDYYVLVSDGLGTIGGALPERAPLPVYALSADPRADHGLLRHLAETSGGAYFNLARMTDQAVLAALGRSAFALIAVDYDPSQVADVLPSGSRPVMGRMTVTGRLLAPEATITLRYGGAGMAPQQRTVTLRQEGAGTTGLVPRYWAQQKAAELAVFPEENHDALLALGRRYGIVTPGTSLLVLERLEQYLEHRIPPPKSRPEMRAEWERRIEEQTTQQKQTEKQKLEQVVAMWESRVAWWERDFAYKPPPAASVTPEGSCPPGEAAIKGSVVDETGAVVPGATVVVQSACGGAPINVETDWQGAFQINGLRPGGLELRVEVEGFRAYRAVGLRVDPNGTLPVRVSLEVGDVSETLNVMAEPSVVSTVSASRAELVEQEEAEEADEAVEGGVVGGVLGGVAGGVVGGLDAVPPPAPPPPMTPALVASPAAAKAKRDGGGGEPAEASITIQAWDPATPYLAKMKEAGEAHAYATYLEERPHYADSPAFYLDCADHLLKIDQRELGLRVLTNVVEMKLEDARLIRIAAHRLQQIGELDLAIELFERVLHLRPEEPQSPRDLALALAARVDAHRAAQADPVKVAEDALRALDLLNDVVVGAWDGRFPEIEVVALMDANRLLAIMEREHLPGIEQVKLDPRLRKLLDVDMRIVMTWDTDLTDMDLWVTEPTGEKCFYSHALTAIGGMISKDFTQGYGPEEYLVRRALAGDYRIQANFYGSRAQQLTGPTTVQATVITRFGRPDEKRQALTLRLGEAKEVVNIGEVQFE